MDNEELLIDEKEGIATATVVNFFNDLFDSVNGYEKNADNNELRCPIIEGSAHHVFWVSAKNILRNMFYIEKASLQIVKSVPTLNNWLFTIDGFQKIWQIIRDKYDFNKLNARFCNQDPLENFFGQIRSHAVRNINPTPRQFEDSFITLLVSNMKSISIVGGNCETIDDGFMLFSLEECLKDETSSTEASNVLRNDICNDEPSELVSDKIISEDSIVTLEHPQEIITCILKKVNYCSECNNSLISNEFSVICRQIVCTVTKLLKTRAHRRNILKVLLQHFDNWTVNMDWHECIEHHDIFQTIVRVISVNTLILWCDEKNKLIKMKK